MDRADRHSVSRFFGMLKLGLRLIWRFVRLCIRVMMYDPLANTPLAGRFRNEDGSRASRFVRGSRIALHLRLCLRHSRRVAFVYAGTHPRSDSADVEPSSLGIYYDPVMLMTDDNVRLEAWLVPAIEAKEVIDQRDKLLREKRPAVVVLHDFASRRQTMLPLIRALHEAGYVVLVPAMRGCGTSDRVGQTFGLHEMLDVKAAVEMLRGRNFVDADRVASCRNRHGANAAVLAARRGYETANAHPRLSDRRR